MSKRHCPHGKVTRGPRKGHCRTSKKSRSGRSRKNSTLAISARKCKGVRPFKSCVRDQMRMQKRFAS